MYFVMEGGEAAACIEGASCGCIGRARRRFVRKRGAGSGKEVLVGVAASRAASMVEGWPGVGWAAILCGLRRWM